MTIVIRPDAAAKCWLVTFEDQGPFPLPFTLDAPVQLVAAELRRRFPGHRITGIQASIQAKCEGCAL